MKAVIVEEVFNATAKTIWKALTNTDEMKKWYFDLPKFEPIVGFEFTFTGQGNTGEKYIHLCKVTEVIPNQRLQYSWEYEHLDGYSLVTFDLIEEGTKTRLKLTHSGLDSFPQDHNDFTIQSFTNGWTTLVTKFLLDYLKGKK
ncbi:SRPBCC domain-containing protein [Aquimarina sp. AU474]|uniref:SRPBCC family protein n=1 Tax=Aquimarina sp. AU474 TaxID=2108529 RepID=UPI000D698308|nr:SRPBCC domain-containing protein [Aquimarina sp. AU474]